MTKTRPRVIDHIERMRTKITALRASLHALHEDDLAPIAAHITAIEEEIDGAESVLRDVVCDANATLDRLL